MLVQLAMIGKTVWAIAEGYIPSGGIDDPEGALISHETACILNAGDEPAEIEITVYFKDREPSQPYHVTVPARRTLHQRFNDLEPPVPRDTDYACVIRSDRPVVVQHTRLDSRRSEVALMTGIAFSQ
jgi:hypothetical protein